MYKQLFIKQLIVIFAAAALISCGKDKTKPPPPPPTAFELVFVAAPDLNPDGENRPSPLVVRVYELKSSTSFENADFFGLFDNDEALLGADLLLKEELEFAVGERRQLMREAQPETQFVGVIGAYRNIEQAAWRASIPIPPNRNSSFVVKLNRLGIAVE